MSMKFNRKDFSMQNPIFEKIQKLHFQIEHNREQSRNTFNLDERENYQSKINSLWESINILLDEYNQELKLAKKG
jgi:hypothetical protein